MADEQTDYKQLDMFRDHGDHIATWSPREIWLRLNEFTARQFSEDGRVERKTAEKAKRLSEMAEYFSMWSNTVEGGIILVGVSNSGDLTGVAQVLSNDQINALESLHTQQCPDSQPDFKRIPIVVGGRKDFLIAIFLPYRGTLVETNRQHAYIRRGDQKHLMSAEEKDDFRSTRHERSWEQRQTSLSYPDDFDGYVVRSFAENFRRSEEKPRWTDEDVLVDRSLMIREGKNLVPLNAMALFAAKNPRWQIPGARVRIQRFSGTEEGSGQNFSPIRDVYVEGHIPHILEKAASVIKGLNYDVTWLNSDGKFETTSEYPRWAWFEALVNALVHRSYSFSGSEVTVKFFSDRLEIESPGGFVPPVNALNVYNLRASRNPNLMDALRHFGFTRMTREGTRRMRESMEAWNLPAPDFSQEAINGVSVRVTLRNEHTMRKRATDKDVAAYCGVEKWKQLTEHEIQIIGYAFNNGAIQVAEAARLTGRQWNTSKKDLDRLVQQGLLKFNAGKFSRDPKAHYAIVRNADF